VVAAGGRGSVLVTGAGGFIGSRVVDRLAERGVDVLALVRPGSARGRLVPRPTAVRIVEADFNDAGTVGALLAEAAPGALVHLAWHTEPGRYLTDPGNLADMTASLRLFELAGQRGCRRVVGVGTCLEYDCSRGRLREDTPLAPRSPYASCKAALFLAGREWARQRGVSFAWARIFYPYGPREDERRLVASVATSLLAGRRVATTTGEQRRDYIHVDDVADALASIVLGDLEGAVNVGTGAAPAVREIIATIARTIGRADLVGFGERPSSPDEPAEIRADIGRLRRELGWRPSISLEQGLGATIEWWRRNLGRDETIRVGADG
jgi:nucleoside-diphosphate-sugar epimerase